MSAANRITLDLLPDDPMVAVWDGRTFYLLRDARYGSDPSPLAGASDLERELALARLREWARKIEDERP